MSTGIPVVISDGDGKFQFAPLASISVGLDDPNSFDESLLQELIDATPSILPIREYLPSTSTLFSLGREVSVDLGEFTGRIDNLLVTNDGHLVIVETKLHRNQKGMREVITQTFQYGTAVSRMTLTELETLLRRCQYPVLKSDETIRQCVSRHAAERNLSNLLAEDFERALERHLRLGEITLLIVADGIHDSVERVTNWYNEQKNSSPIRFGLIELKFHVHGNEKLVIPRAVLKTREISRHVVVVDIRSKPADVIATAEIIPIDNTAEELEGGYGQSKPDTPPLTERELLLSVADDDRPHASNLLDRLKSSKWTLRGATSDMRIGFSYPQEGGKFYPIAYLTDEGVWVFLPKALRTLMGADEMVEFHQDANCYGQFYEVKEIEKSDGLSGTVKYKQVMESGNGFVAFLDTFRTKAIGLLESEGEG